MAVTIQRIVLNFSPKTKHGLLSLAKLLAIRFQHRQQKAGEVYVLCKEHFLFSVHRPTFLQFLLVLFFKQ